jgi:UDP-N-acetylglucosamine--N-acetylmuramyl-(pentapeptide) pyrophosphoryl-undecaprenol N-acetylglucosamine transferase
LGPRVRTELTGIPLRDGFARRTPAAPPRTLLVTGGSQGARRLNQAVWEALEALLVRFQEVIHVAGGQGAEEAGRLAKLNPAYRGLAFSDDMPGLMAAADLVVSRAGVGTIGELTAVGLPAILVPGTFGGAHQELNAEALVRAGAAVRVADADLTGERLLRELDGLDEARLRAMAEASAGLGRPDAAQRVVRVLERVAS